MKTRNDTAIRRLLEWGLTIPPPTSPGAISVAVAMALLVLIVLFH